MTAEQNEIQVSDSGKSTQQWVSEIWAELLKKDESSLAADDDFFAVGGNSMTATLCIYKLREVTGLELPMMLIFENPTMAELVKAIDNFGQNGL